MNWNSSKQVEQDSGVVLGSLELQWALLWQLTVEEGQTLVENFRTYEWSYKFVKGVRMLFLAALGLFVLSLLPWCAWLAAFRWLLGLVTLVAYLGIYLMLPVLEGAIDTLQGLADKALARAGLPPFVLRK